MNIRLVSIGRRMPRWVEEGYAEYAKRLPAACRLELVALEPARRTVKGTRSAADLERIRADEGERLLRAIPDGSLVIALDERGQTWSTADLARELTGWLGGGRDVALLVGGPDGLASACLAQAHRRWSLSALTFPHPLVRIIVAEQLYRAWTLVQGHPYHRA
jgi:23S rRNA (pseudouridine1915-N3)-methyltransferase